MAKSPLPLGTNGLSLINFPPSICPNFLNHDVRVEGGGACEWEMRRRRSTFGRIPHFIGPNKDTKEYPQPEDPLQKNPLSKHNSNRPLKILPKHSLVGQKNFEK
jgi:hypothetical protein